MWALLSKNKRSDSKSPKVETFNGCLSPYHESKSYLSAITVLFKAILIVVIFLPQVPELKILFAICVLYGYKWLTIDKNPFRNRTYQTLASISLQAFLATAFLTIFLKLYSIGGLGYASYIGILAINIIAIFNLLLCFLGCYKGCGETFTQTTHHWFAHRMSMLHHKFSQALGFGPGAELYEIQENEIGTKETLPSLSTEFRGNLSKHYHTN